MYRTLWMTLLSAAMFALPGAVAAQVSVRLVVIIPVEEQPPERIFVSLSTDNWAPEGRPLERIADGLYEARIKLPARRVVEYKFKRGPNWSTVEKDAAGREIANRYIRIPQGVSEYTVFHQVERWAGRAPPRMSRKASFQRLAALGHGTPEGEHSTRTGQIRVHPNIFSERLGNVRQVDVYLPPGYNRDRKRRYPVLYMQDGQNVFDVATSYGVYEWEVDETCQRLIRERSIEPLIVVGIHNTSERTAEYTPFKDNTLGGGKGDAYLAFVVHTLKPFIDRTYRTRPEQEHTGIGGSSLGGLISLYALWKHPDVFSKAAALSPTLEWADGRILTMIASEPAPASARLWIDMGTREGDEADDRARRIEKLRAAVAVVKKAGLTADEVLHAEEVPGGTHHETAWAARIDRILAFLYPAPSKK